MFSGIIEYQAQILKKESSKFILKNPFGEVLKVGQSIAHDGACMTIEWSNQESYSFFAMEETLHKTNFFYKNVGDNFNVERCIKTGARLDGHFVTGHIDCVGSLREKLKKEDNSILLEITFPEVYRKYLIEKGSISINGISLTVYNIQKDHFYVSIIPLTQKMTNLGILEKNSIVNLEFDMLGKYILNTKYV